MRGVKITLIAIFFFMLQGVAAQTSARTAAPKLIDPTTNCKLRYYYYPNLEAYYDTAKNLYYYTEKGKWIVAEEIPAGYRGYSIYNKCKIAITNYDDEDPTQFLKIHKKQFPYAPNGKIKNMMASVE